MNISKLAIALATFATITLSSAAYIATKEVTSAVLVDKAKHSLDLTTNGLHNISVGEAFTIDKSEATQINFLRCSFARPEFRFSWFCHQLKSDGKMTKQSYVALKADQEKYFKENVIKSISYEAQKWFSRSEQLRFMNSITRSEPFVSGGITASKRSEYIAEYVEAQSKSSGVNGEAKAVKGVEQGGRELSKAGTETVIRKNLSDAQAFAVSPLTETDRVSIQELYNRLGDTEIPSKIKDLDPILFRALADEQSKDYVVDFRSIFKSLGLVQEDTHENKNAGVGKNERTTNEKIIAGISIAILLSVIVILIWAIIIEIKKLEQKLLNEDFDEKKRKMNQQ